ncbi:hypothetical protein ABZ876_34070 [Streptomyces sp. NPDC046931]|uniref:hypothetical protein n=1 Tax=Streptomyces sp. NPDC046931 TaxID=3154806 RepID=UPI0033E90787
MSDGITWLAEPKSIDWGGYSVVIALDLAGETLAARVAAGRYGRNKQQPRFLGSLTGRQADDVMSGLFGDTHNAIALRYGEIDEWSYVVQHGFWYGEFGPEPPVSQGGAHIFRLWYEEENGKPVPPFFSYEHDGRTVCSFNLHLDGSWGSGRVDGDADVVSALEAELTAAGLRLDDPEGRGDDRRALHRTCLGVIERHFGLTLPRDEILNSPLPTLLMKANVAKCPFCGAQQS